ncbi:hypothetical protein K435DRAFT_778774 [Dendrothele bispora CBS 962.96]|uniref:Uncharacterized protein n=1 Tax=Dendrothele bispora (strain CBS 962.96) TaxID=1314807 RepID=A0A4S8M2T5_DENBC|nr:hypothetical protein K435DRAFT_778774 [Dendrothele bispora CBS 962.96]
MRDSRSYSYSLKSGRLDPKTLGMTGSSDMPPGPSYSTSTRFPESFRMKRVGGKILNPKSRTILS